MREVIISFDGAVHTSIPSGSQREEQQDYCIINTRTGYVAIGLFGGDEEVGWNKDALLQQNGTVVDVGSLGANYYL